MLYGYNDYLYVIDHHTNCNMLTAEFTELYQDMTGMYPHVTYSIMHSSDAYEINFYIHEYDKLECITAELRFLRYPRYKRRIKEFRRAIRDIIKRKFA